MGLTAPQISMALREALTDCDRSFGFSPQLAACKRAVKFVEENLRDRSPFLAGSKRTRSMGSLDECNCWAQFSMMSDAEKFAACMRTEREANATALIDPFRGSTVNWTVPRLSTQMCAGRGGVGARLCHKSVGMCRKALKDGRLV